MKKTTHSSFVRMLSVLLLAVGVGLGNAQTAYGLHCSVEPTVSDCHEHVCNADMDDYGHEHHDCTFAPDAMGPFVKGRSLSGKQLSVAMISQRGGTSVALLEKDRPIAGWTSASSRTSIDLLESVLLRL